MDRDVVLNVTCCYLSNNYHEQFVTFKIVFTISIGFHEEKLQPIYKCNAAMKIFPYLDSFSDEIFHLDIPSVKKKISYLIQQYSN